MAEITIAAESRTEFGKGAARRIRRADKVPGVLYEHGNDPLHVTLPGHDLMLALKNSNALLNIELDGTYHNLGLFFDRVSKFSRIINVGAIAIRAKDKPELNSTITAECVATTFVLLEPKPAAKPAAAPAAKAN